MDNVGVLLFLVGAVGTWYFIKKEKDAQKRNISIGLILLGFLLIGIFGEPSDTEQATPESTVESTLSSSELQAIEESKEAERLAEEEAAAKAKEEEEKKKAEEEAAEADKKAKEEAERIERANIMNLEGEATTEQKAILNDLAQQQFKETFPYKGSKIKSVLGIKKDWRAINGEWYYRAEAVIVNAFDAKQETDVIIKIVPETESSGYVTIELP